MFKVRGRLGYMFRIFFEISHNGSDDENGEDFLLDKLRNGVLRDNIHSW